MSRDNSGGVMLEHLPATESLIAVDDLTVPAPAPIALAAEAERAALVMLGRSPETQRTYRGIYDRFGVWLAAQTGVDPPPVTAFTAEALVAYLTEREDRAAASTVKKERAALRKLARYLHQLRLIDATVILMVETRPETEAESSSARQGLDGQSWERVLTVARASRS